MVKQRGEGGSSSDMGIWAQMKESTKRDWTGIKRQESRGLEHKMGDGGSHQEEDLRQVRDCSMSPRLGVRSWEDTG